MPIKQCSKIAEFILEFPHPADSPSLACRGHREQFLDDMLDDSDVVYVNKFLNNTTNHKCEAAVLEDT